MAATKISSGLTATPGALTRMGCALMGSGEGDKAVALVDSLLSRSPGDPEIEAAARTILSHNVPRWHWAMLHDERRNLAFERAIARAVRPGCRVLDIGTGSGLLAMMAARAGAGSVIACEANPALAATARKIVAANGFGDVIAVHARRSTELRRESELAGGADVIIAEIFSDDLLEEGALATLSRARAELAAPGVRMLPAAATIRVALAAYDAPLRFGPVSNVNGFDLSLFDRHVSGRQSVKVANPKLQLRSEPADLFRFDFQDARPFAGERARLELTAGAGGADGLVQWIGLQLDDATAYENRPDPDMPSHWAAIFHPLPGGKRLDEGGAVSVHASHDTERIQVWFD
jgi:type II protein arginine methyltransferase